MNDTAHYITIRDSTRTERERLLATVTDLQKRLADTERRSELGFDPAYSRTAARLRKEVITAREKVEAFNKKQGLLNAARTGEDARAAQKEAQKAARDFEERLVAFAAAASTLKTKAAILADALQVEIGLWPSRREVDTAVKGRVIEILGSAGIKLEGFVSSEKPSQPLTSQFELNQGK